MTSKVKFFETSSGSLQVGDGQRSGYPAPLYQIKRTLKSVLSIPLVSKK